MFVGCGRLNDLLLDISALIVVEVVSMIVFSLHAACFWSVFKIKKIHATHRSFSPRNERTHCCQDCALCENGGESIHVCPTESSNSHPIIQSGPQVSIPGE